MLRRFPVRASAVRAACSISGTRVVGPRWLPPPSNARLGERWQSLVQRPATHRAHRLGEPHDRGTTSRAPSLAPAGCPALLADTRDSRSRRRIPPFRVELVRPRAVKPAVERNSMRVIARERRRSDRATLASLEIDACCAGARRPVWSTVALPRDRSRRNARAGLGSGARRRTEPARQVPLPRVRGDIVSRYRRRGPRSRWPTECSPLL